MTADIGFLKDSIDQYIQARDAFLKAALRGGFLANKDDKKIEASAREAFITARAHIFNAAEREYDSSRACEIMDHLEEQGILA